MGLNWESIFITDALERLGAGCGSLDELATALGGELGTPVSSNALYAAHNRAWERLELKKSLTEYLGNTKRMRLKPEDLIFSLDEDRMKEVDRAKRFVITSALNNTPLEENVWLSLQRYAKEQDAMILVVPSRYKNPTSKAESSKENRDAWWPQETLPYLTDDRILLHEHCYLVADVRVQATASKPLTGLESFSGPASAIYGHANLAMKMVPVTSNRLPKVLYTTGSISQARYSDTKQGVRGSSHHGFGGVVLERDGARFHIRPLVSDPTGGFYDLDRYYGPKSSKKSKRALALVTGDTHAQFADPKCALATFHNADSICAVVNPEKIIRHDLLDFAASGHHNRKDPIHKIAVHAAGMQYVEKELELTTQMLNDTTPPNTENVVVASNHNEHLMRWLKEVCAPLEEPWNANIWIELWSALKDTIVMGEGGAECGDPFALWAEQRLTVKARFLERGESYMVGDIEVSLHGDAGTNGSRGSLNQFSKLGVRTVTGHSHSPGITHGAYAVGTSSRLKLSYNRAGASSWAHCHCIIHPNGKRQLVFVIDGKWRRDPDRKSI